VFGLVSRGARVEVSARRSEAATELANAFGARAVGWPPAPGWDLLVNTTPVGMWPDIDPTPLPASAINGGCVYDLIYNPAETALMRLAREAGVSVIGGLDMLVAQAERQYFWWTGQQPVSGVMQKAGRAFVEHRESQPV
jgi:shikimate 5-dehydrogenase